VHNGPEFPQPDAMTLATAGAGRVPSARMVLFKGLETALFSSIRTTRAAKQDLAANNRQLWSSTGPRPIIQVRASGTVRRVSRAESSAYFHTRPPGAQLSALASRRAV